MSERLRYTELAPEGIAEMRGLEHYLNASTALPAVLLELVRLRVSLLNGCEFCIGHHSKELQKHNEPESRIEALAKWTDSDAFTPRERSALAWADAVTTIQNGHAAAPEYEAVSTYFEGKDLVDLTLAIASINAWNRLSIAFRAEWNPSRKKSATQAAEPAQGRDTPKTTNGASGASGTSGAAGSSEAEADTPPSPGTASSPIGTTPAHEDAPTKNVIDDDGGKVAHD